MATLPIGGGLLSSAYANVANYVPEIWSKELLVHYEHNLVIANLVDRRFEAAYSYGDVVHVANLHNITATVTNSLNTITLYDSVQNKTDITINQWYHAGVSEPDALRKMSQVDYLKAVVPKIGYALAKQVDDSLATQIISFSQTVGTEGVAITDDTLIAAKEYLDLADAPFEDRSLILDPESLGDLLKIDKFVRADYVAGGAIAKGRVGNIYGCPVYITTNLDEINTNYHAGTMMHKQAMALVEVMKPSIEAFRDWTHLSDGIVGQILFGYAEMRDTSGVWIKTRS